MSRADQLLSKLPPATPLPSFVTDALNGNNTMKVLPFVFFLTLKDNLLLLIYGTYFQILDPLCKQVPY